ncbi:MAG TPA: hypothetical protein ENK57_02865, partial [Polyangiaceae bacterium]|nr:hypothetical protein [Polyangiaceae bacterium]
MNRDTTQMTRALNSILMPVTLSTVVVLSAGCTGDDVAEVSTDVCSSGLQWVGGDSESPEMHPGRDCIGCHTDRGEGPRFTSAGTVFLTYDEADDCFGVEGVDVSVTDSTGATLTMTTNAAGNFYFEEESFVPPVTARVSYAGGSLEMTTAVPSANCASCHTVEGLNGAP